MTVSPAPLQNGPGGCAWSALAEVHESLGRDVLAEGRSRSAGGHLSQAAVYYHFAKFFWTHDLQEMRHTHGRAVSCFMDALPHLDPPGRRIEVPLDNGRMIGVLRAPRSAGPHPVVILVPGLDSAKEELRPNKTAVPRPRSGHICRGRARAGRGRVRPADPARLGGPRGGDDRRARRAARGGCHAYRGLGCEPGRVLRSPDRDGRARVRAVISLSGPFQFETAARLLG